MYAFEFTTQRGQVTSATITQFGEALAIATLSGGAWHFTPVAGKEPELSTALAQGLQLQFDLALGMETVRAMVELGATPYGLV